jgi:hypothetical protein
MLVPKNVQYCTHLYGTSIFRCNFFFVQSIPKKFQLYNVSQKRILRMIFFCLYVDNSTCYVGFHSTMRRHWMTFLVEKCNIGLWVTKWKQMTNKWSKYYVIILLWWQIIQHNYLKNGQVFILLEHFKDVS